MNRALLLRWLVAAIGFLLGSALLWHTESIRSDVRGHAAALTAMKAEKQRSAAPKPAQLLPIAEILSSAGIAPKVQTTGKTHRVTLEQESANTVVQAVTALERRHSLQVKRLQMTVVAPGLVSGSLEVVSP